MGSCLLSLEVITSGSGFQALELLPCAPEGEAHPLSPPRAQALGALMLAAHLQPTLQGAAGKSEREPGALCQDLERQQEHKQERGDGFKDCSIGQAS